MKRLSSFGYVFTRQKGLHIRPTTVQNGENHLAIPVRESLRVETRRSILGNVAEHFGATIEELADPLFLGE